jgi:hypothetical protein
MISFKQVAALCGAIALLTPAPARAEWVQVASSDYKRIDIETDSITSRGTDIFFVTRSLYAFPDEVGAIAKVSSQSINCLTGVRAFYRIVGFNGSGRVVFNENQGVARAKASPPGSMGASIYDFVCR